MSQEANSKADTRSFLSGDTFASYAVVTFMTAGSAQGGPFIRAWQTDTQAIIGVAQRGASATGEAIAVTLAGPTAKCLANASISAGAIVGPATDAAGRIMERPNPGTVTTFMVPTIGIALEAGSLTNATVEVLLQPVSTRPSDG